MSTAASTIAIMVNGSDRQTSSNSSLADLLRAEKIDPDYSTGIAVAINGEIVRGTSWSSTRLQDGDRVEIVTARQGG